MAELSRKVYTFEKETPGTYRFQRDENGRKDTVYVPKSAISGPRPDQIEVVINSVE